MSCTAVNSMGVFETPESQFVRFARMECKPGGFLKPLVCGFDDLQTRVPGYPSLIMPVPRPARVDRKPTVSGHLSDRLAIRGSYTAATRLPAVNGNKLKQYFYGIKHRLVIHSITQRLCQRRFNSKFHLLMHNNLLVDSDSRRSALIRYFHQTRKTRGFARTQTRVYGLEKRRVYPGFQVPGLHSLFARAAVVF